MTSLRKLFALFAVMALAAFALPSMADTKNFYAEVPSVGGNPVYMVVHNVSTGNGVSTINSMQVCVSSPSGVTITNVQKTAPTAETPTMTPAAGGTCVVLTNFTGIVKASTATFAITLSNLPPSCVPIVFTAGANSGNAGRKGDVFNPTRTDLLTVGCSQGILKCPSIAGNPGETTAHETGPNGNVTDLTRFENKDLSACVAIPFSVNFSNQDRTVSILWDQLSQPFAALQSDTTWPPALINPLTGLPDRTQYSLDGTNFYNVPTCLSSD